MRTNRVQTKRQIQNVFIGGLVAPNVTAKPVASQNIESELSPALNPTCRFNADECALSTPYPLLTCLEFVGQYDMNWAWLQ